MTVDTLWPLLASLLAPDVLGALFAASLLGVVVGAVPGLTATLALALLLGFAAVLPLEYMLVVLLGVYVGGIYGGSITAIVLNIPGTGSAAATTLDGHPLALAGRAGYAIALTRGASVIGTGISAGLMLLLAPALARFALHFTSPEFFSLALFGLLTCGVVASGNAPDATLKGCIGVCIGLLLAFVGLDDIEGTERLTGGIPELLSGISFIPFMIGLYAIPEILAYYAQSIHFRPRPLTAATQSSVGVLARLKTKTRLIVQSALIGVGIGILPGVGEDIAAWVAYGTAKKTSRTPETFGQGNEEGIIAPEVANNAAIGGSIIPVLALGMPGSPPAAMFMAALLLYGLQPGPMLIMEQPELLTRISLSLFLADIALLFAALLLLRPILLLLKTPGYYLMPVVAAVCAIGAYAANLAAFDFIVMFLAGGCGYLLRCMGYAPAPLVLGLILGKMLDVKFRTALIVSDGSFAPFFTRPIACVFLLLALFHLVKVVKPCGISTWTRKIIP